MNLASTSTTNNEMHISEERLANERERNRVRQRTRRLNMTEEQRSIESGRDRNRYTAAKENLNHASTSTGNNDAHIFEHVIHRHVQAEVGRLIGRVSAIRMNTTEGYMELGPQHRGKLYVCKPFMLYNI
ncbi:hypothetical protein MKW98_029740 [Papaver atlanticum]|uniref:Uncharacterized protein n=1 Tax=Papaver atlanticum TaxID=357466 RepID=A0AAD4T6I7_9MAGN|nr:hypothetical protein MKW98_029740 [Papaver atlanticum]